MWDVVLDVAAGLWPSRGAQVVEQGDRDSIIVDFGPGAVARRLNESGWLSDEVIAAGALRQGKAPSLLTAVTGLVLIELARRRSKSLPREFVLAATAERVVAFAMSAEGTDGTTTVVKIRRGELSSWPRELVRLLELTDGLFTRGATLELAGVERFPVTSDGDDSTSELFELLSR
jgi:hypothetical protein